MAEKILKYAKPRIMLIDMDEQSADILDRAGFNVSKGSFGTPTSVAPSATPHPVSLKTFRLPSFEEQEIIVINLESPEVTKRSAPDDVGEGVDAYWQTGVAGKIDPRPLAMAGCRKQCERILAHDGIFIVLLADRYEASYVFGAKMGFEFRTKNEHKFSSWGFLTDLDEMDCESHRGTEIQYDLPLLHRGSTDARYSCVVGPRYIRQKEQWSPLATNKYGECVAGVLNGGGSNGQILLLPQMPNVNTILVEILEEWCSQWCPKFFPYHEGMRWLHEPRYELPSVNILQETINRVKNESTQRISDLEAEIERTRAENSNWYALINGTGRELVVAVIQGLKQLGFSDVVDVDESASQADRGNLREDIQILDNSPNLIVDVKGIVGTPEDADATQSQKHALMRGKEFKGDVKALTIINPQRNIPPHSRNPHPYRNEIVDNALQTDLGLMTTFDLFRILRNKEHLGWRNEDVRPILYRSGRIEPVPIHYTELGTIAHVWEQSFGIVPKRGVSVRARIAVEVDIMYYETTAVSLQVDDVQVKRADAGSNCGMRCPDGTGRFKKGMKVFLIEDGIVS